MTTYGERFKRLKFNLHAALENLAEKSSKFDPDSAEVQDAQKLRALREKDFYDFLDKGA